MKKNKILAIFLTLVMVVSMLAACSKGNDSKGTTNNSSGQQSNVEQKQEEKKEEKTDSSDNKTETPATKTGVIKIGAIHDLSGSGSVLGNASVQGHKLAVEDINNAGGVTIGDTTYSLELIAYDCKSDPNEGISALKRLAEVDNVVLVLGPSLSNVGLATAPYTDEYGISFLGQFGDPR